MLPGGPHGPLMPLMTLMGLMSLMTLLALLRGMSENLKSSHRQQTSPIQTDTKQALPKF